MARLLSRVLIVSLFIHTVVSNETEDFIKDIAQKFLESFFPDLTKDTPKVRQRPTAGNPQVPNPQSFGAQNPQNFGQIPQRQNAQNFRLSPPNPLGAQGVLGGQRLGFSQVPANFNQLPPNLNSPFGFPARTDLPANFVYPFAPPGTKVEPDSKNTQEFLLSPEGGLARNVQRPNQPINIPNHFPTIQNQFSTGQNQFTPGQNRFPTATRLQTQQNTQIPGRNFALPPGHNGLPQLRGDLSALLKANQPFLHQHRFPHATAQPTTSGLAAVGPTVQTQAKSKVPALPQNPNPLLTSEQYEYLLASNPQLTYGNFSLSAPNSPQNPGSSTAQNSVVKQQTNSKVPALPQNPNQFLTTEQIEYLLASNPQLTYGNFSPSAPNLPRISTSKPDVKQQTAPKPQVLPQNPNQFLTAEEYEYLLARNPHLAYGNASPSVLNLPQNSVAKPEAKQQTPPKTQALPENQNQFLTAEQYEYLLASNPQLSNGNFSVLNSSPNQKHRVFPFKPWQIGKNAQPERVLPFQTEYPPTTTTTPRPTTTTVKRTTTTKYTTTTKTSAESYHDIYANYTQGDCAKCISVDLKKLTGAWTQIYGSASVLRATYSTLLSLRNLKLASDTDTVTGNLKPVQPSCIGWQMTNPRVDEEIQQYKSDLNLFFRDDGESRELHELIGRLRKNIQSREKGFLFDLNGLSMPLCVLKTGENGFGNYGYVILVQTSGVHKCRSYHVFARDTESFFRNYNTEVVRYLKQEVSSRSALPLSVVPFPELCEITVSTFVQEDSHEQ